MSTNIEWTQGMKTATGDPMKGETWNPTVGCSEVSRGCRDCYAARMAWRIMHMHTAAGKDYEGTVKKLDNGRIVWTGKVNMLEHRLLLPAQTKKPTTWFVDSMSDLFHEDIPFTFIDKVFAIMMLCPQHIFQILTKRIDRALEYLQSRQDFDEILEAAELLVLENAELFCVLDKTKYEGKALNIPTNKLLNHLSAFGWYSSVTYVGYGEEGDYDKDHEFLYEGNFPAKHIWIGTSIENQKAANDRGPALYDLHRMGWMTWVSNEPCVGPIDWEAPHYFGFLDWMVTGGESGATADPMHPDWARATRDFCEKNNIPFFFKQWGQWATWDEVSRAPNPHSFEVIEFTREGYRLNDDQELDDADGDVRLYKAGKHTTGRSLDGKTYDAHPDLNKLKTFSHANT